MDCPHCNSREFELTVVLTGGIHCRFRGQDIQLVGSSVALDSDFHPESPCRCLRCNWEGKAGDAMDAEELAKHAPTPHQLTDTELAQIQLEVESENCPPLVQNTLQTLLTELKLLRAQVEVVRRVRRRHGDTDLAGDTALL